MWFDHTFGKWDLYTIPRLFEKMYSHNPKLLVNDRAARGLPDIPAEYEPLNKADFDTPENRMGAFQYGRAWESCMILSPHADHGGWSYRPGWRHPLAHGNAAPAFLRRHRRWQYAAQPGAAAGWLDPPGRGSRPQRHRAMDEKIRRRPSTAPAAARGTMAHGAAPPIAARTSISTSSSPATNRSTCAPCRSASPPPPPSTASRFPSNKPKTRSPSPSPKKPAIRTSRC